MLEKTTIQPTYNEGKKENDNRIVTTELMDPDDWEFIL